MTWVKEESLTMATVVAATVSWAGAYGRKAALVVQSGGSRKVTERVVTQLRRSRQDARAVGGAVRRLDSHSKATQIQTLQHLFDAQDWELALLVYNSLRKKDWYQWNPTIHARLVALLAVTEQSQEAQLFVSEPPESLSARDEVKLQVCLIDSYAKCGLFDKALTAVQGLQFHPLPGAGRWSYRALLRAYVSLELPHEGYLVMGDMRKKGFSPGLDDYKAVLYAFGRGGHLAHMEKVACELNKFGLKLDLSGFNMMLSSYGQAKNFDAVAETLERMHKLNITCSINTRNAISRSCPTLISLCEVMEEFPPSVVSLCSSLELIGVQAGELKAIRELLSLGLPLDSVKWEQDIWELDLHHMFVGTANIVLFLWLHELKAFYTAGVNFPLKVRVVTGWGKHSDSEGRSVVREKVRELLERMKSPFKPDSQNQGVLLSGGYSLKAWFTAHLRTPVY